MTRVVAHRRRRHFVDQLRGFRGRRVEITTPYGNVVGTLRTVHPEHIVVTNEDGTHLVRIASTCWIRPEQTTPS